MNLTEIKEIVEAIEVFPGSYFVVQRADSRYRIQYRFPRPDANTGEVDIGFSRWEYIELHHSEDYVVKTCFVLVKLTMEHECMEMFRYRDCRLFDPHTPVSDLMRLQIERER